MSSTSTASTRICPVCNAPNSNFSLFCAECGASLNAPDEGDTAAFEPVSDASDDAQRTASFEPTTANREAVDTATPETSFSSTATMPASDSAPFSSTWDGASASPAASDRVWHPDAEVVQPVPSPAGPTSMRGFFLGLVAGLMMLAVFLLWSWATLLDSGTRDSISDFFGFLG